MLAAVNTGCWDSNPGPLDKQPVLLTTEPPSSPPRFCGVFRRDLRTQFFLCAAVSCHPHIFTEIARFAYGSVGLCYASGGFTLIVMYLCPYFSESSHYTVSRKSAGCMDLEQMFSHEDGFFVIK